MKAGCQNPRHEGDRLVERRELLELRLEWRRLTDQGRDRTRIIRRECKTCAVRDLGQPSMQEAFSTMGITLGEKP